MFASDVTATQMELIILCWCMYRAQVSKIY